LGITSLTEYVYNGFPWSQNTYLLNQGLVPDFILRRAIRLLLRQRLREIDAGSFEANHAAKMKWIEEVRARTTIADVPEKANEQHYEVRSFIYLEGHSLPRMPFSWSMYICEVTAVVDGIPSCLHGVHFQRTSTDTHTLQVSTDFILSTLGPYGKYSSCLYPTGRETLAEAERFILESYCEKAHMRDGIDVLDLGCGMHNTS